MGVPEAVQRLVSRSEALATNRRVRSVAQLLLLIALIFVALRLHSIWHDSHVDVADVDWALLAAAGVLAVGAVVAAGFIWIEILRRLAVEPRARWVAIFLEAQLAKYIPGSIWHYAGRAALARTEGVAVRVVALSVSVELAATVGAGAVAASLALGLKWFIVVAVVGTVALIVGWRYTIRRVRLPGQLAAWLTPASVQRTIRATSEGTALYAVVWAMLAVSFWLTARALFAVPVAQLPYYVGAYSVACLVGLFAFFAPVGFGVREALLVALLQTRLGTADALVLAAASRLLLTLVDLATAAAGAAARRWTRNPAAKDGPVSTTSFGPTRSNAASRGSASRSKHRLISTLGRIPTTARRNGARVVVLCYHSIDPQLPFSSAHPKLFRSHLDWLKANCAVVSLENALELVKSDRGKSRERPVVAITFDDGYADNYEHAYPLLRALELPATFFVTVGLVDGDPAVISRLEALQGTGPQTIEGMRWEDVRELRRAGFGIGSHTYSHPNLALLNRTDAAADIDRAKTVLEEKLGASSDLFAYPFGKPGHHFSSETVEIVRRAGYAVAAAVLFRRVKSTDDPLMIPRFFVRNDDLQTLEAKVRGSWDAIGWAQEHVPLGLARVAFPDDFAHGNEGVPKTYI
jgi:glycosyltransferase 2 family protein